jgi:hypothetical protein
MEIYAQQHGSEIMVGIPMLTRQALMKGSEYKKKGR